VPDSQNTETRFLESLASSGQFERLATYLGSNEPLSVRRKSAHYLSQSLEALAEQDTAALIEELYEAVLAETDDTVRAKIIEILVYFEDAAIDTLVEMIESDEYPTPTDSPHPLLYVRWLDSKHVELRLLAVAGLGSVGSKQVAGKLAAACTDHDDRIRIRALEECGRLEDPRCVEAVAACLDATNIDVRTAAAKALIRIGTEESITAVLPLAKEGDRQVRQAVIEEIGSVGSLAVFGVILKALDHDDEQFRATAARATVELIANAPSADRYTIRRTIAIHLQRAPDRELVAEIRAITDAEEPTIRRDALWLLGELLDPNTHTESLQTLIRSIADPDTKTAKVAVSQLVELEESLIIDHLEAFIQARDLDTQALKRADFIREELTAKTADDHLKDAVEYTKVSDPSDYTAKHAEDS
jgi:HEAT repeat protein